MGGEEEFEDFPLPKWMNLSGTPHGNWLFKIIHISLPSLWGG